MTLEPTRALSHPTPSLHRGLTKLELVDLMPASASLACLAGLPHLRHLIVEYKDGTATPDLQSIGQIQGLTHLELSLHG